MSYDQALRKLESLPVDEQELASGRYVFEVRDNEPHCGCAIGKLLTEEDRRALVRCNSNQGNVSELRRWLASPGEPYADEICGLALPEMRHLQYFNDRAAGKLDNSDAARRLRYRLVIEWLREQCAIETRRSALAVAP